MPTIVDTVVAHYFLLVGRFELLIKLLDSEVVMSRIVFDPDDDSAANDDVVSELTRGINYHSRAAQAADAPSDQRARSWINAERVTKIRD